VLGGILGFVPGITKEGMFLGIFMVNAPHSIMHIISGVIFLVTSLFGERFVRLWFQTFGIAYAGMALIGFNVGDAPIFGLISNNGCDSWGHAALATVLLIIGFASPKQTPNSI